MLAHAFNVQGGHDEFGAACFTCTVFSITVLSEVVPFEIATLEFSLVVEAHYVYAIAC